MGEIPAGEINRKNPSNLNSHMLIKKSQAILKHFIDLKFSLRFTLHGGAPNGSVPQNICSSGNILLAGRFRKINMSLDGKCWWEIDISGCLRGFGVRNSPPPTHHMTTPITFRIPPPPHPPLTEELNFAL